MTVNNKTILRSILILSYIVIIVLVVFGISVLFSYLNTGADRNSMLHTEVKKIDQYLPTVRWSPLINEGRTMDKTTLNDIENDYLDAWYVKHVAFLTNLETGIDDYYTESARKNIVNIIDINKTENISIEATTLNHETTLEFFSEDGQLAVITDRNVVEYKRFYKNKEFQFETKEVSTYKVMLLLEDGFWRIRHMVKQESSPFANASNAVDLEIAIKGINYYPQVNPWDTFGDQFSKDIISKDFKIIKEAGLNSVRIFVQYDDFGKADVNPGKLYKLKQTLDAAENNGIGVVVTLFDFYGDYSVLNWTLNQSHAETIVSELKDHKALLAWDIKNEPNLDFDSRGKELVISWLDNMIDLVKSVDGVHPVTIGWSNTQSASILKDKVDLVSFHYYEDLNKLDEAIKSLKTEIPNKPLVLQEFGLSSYSGFWKPFGGSEKKQTNYHQKAQEIIANNNLQFMSWTLYDFGTIPKEVVGRLPWRKNIQKQFGFINSSGIEKDAFKYISQP